MSVRSTEAILHEIAVNVIHSKHSVFLYAVADAYLRADSENEKILRPAWLVLIDKYKLDKEYEPTQAAEAEP
jgi:hypothetical protein